MRVLIWVGGGLVAAAVIAAIGLQIAIWRNGAAVLNAIDRLAGGSQSVERIATAQFGPNTAQSIAVYRQTDAEQGQPVVLFVHGGSWKTGDPEDYDFIGRNFSSQGFVTVVAGYRLFPEGRFPAMVEDAAGAIGWTYREIGKWGGDPSQIYLMGHSAGAYNVMQAALDRRWLAAEGVPQSAIAGVVGLAGPADFYPFDSDSTRDAFGHADDPQSTQPINFARGDAPPLLLLHGGNDTSVKPRNSKALAKAIEEVGGRAKVAIFDGEDHSYPLVSLAHPWRDRRPVMAEMQRFIAETRDTAENPSLAVQPESR